MIAHGRVRAVRDGAVEIDLPAVPVGSMVRLDARPHSLLACVVSVHDGGARVAPQGSLEGIVPGACVVEEVPRGLQRAAPPRRVALREPLWTGVRAIDALLTLGRGARIGIFGGPGLGKSTLLETIVEGTRADAVVLALVGERGREAQRWTASRDRRTTIFCATSDRSATERIAAANEACTRSEALARRGLHVLLVMDSLARYALAVRDVALARGESVGRAGYPPSVFGEMARLVERAGSFERGSITVIATVLNDGDDRDPVSEAARSLLDGHVQLSARLAHAGHFPAIDVPASSSRTMDDVVDPHHAGAAARVRGALALLERARDARSLGIVPVDGPTLRAVAAETALEALVRQGRAAERPERSLEALVRTADTLGGPYEHQL
ncbi:MAG TPA: hypothetical protein VNF68_12970 [Candidatus Baltobacteraceae bacterium]|nr:hypothetical protein [Candidatus Baltobacteraceae bacterium]